MQSKHVKFWRSMAEMMSIMNLKSLTSGNLHECFRVLYNTKNTIKTHVVKLGTQQLDTFLLEKQASKGIGKMKETSENIRNMAELIEK